MSSSEYRLAEQNVKAFCELCSRITASAEPLMIGHLRVRVLSYHRSLQLPRTVIAEHEHPSYEFSFMHSGSMLSQCDTMLIPASECDNRIFFMPPLTFHSRNFGPEPINISEAMVLMINGCDEIGQQLCMMLPEIIRKKGYSFTFSTELRELSKLFGARVTGNDAGHTVALYLLNAFLGSFFLENFPELFDPVQVQKFCSQMDSEFENDKIIAIKNAIEYGLNINAPLSYYATRFGMSLRHLNRIFKSGTGISINQYQTIRKLEFAESMLSASHASIGEIALSLGFSSHELFSVFFRKHRNCTPSEFRHSLAGKIYSRQ